MTPSQLTRTMNWIAMPLALIVAAMVGYHIYQVNRNQVDRGINYQFDDLPEPGSTPVTADIEAIIKQHVFGVVTRAPEPTATVVNKKPSAPVPKTRLNIKLTGIIDGESPEKGIAMLEVERGRTLVVAVGEIIGKTDATLHQVLPGEVLLDRDGVIESVKMVRKKLTSEGLDSSLFNNLPQPSAAAALPGESENLYAGQAISDQALSRTPRSETPAASTAVASPSGRIKRFATGNNKRIMRDTGNGGASIRLAKPGEPEN